MRVTTQRLLYSTFKTFFFNHKSCESVIKIHRGHQMLLHDHKWDLELGHKISNPPGLFISPVLLTSVILAWSALTLDGPSKGMCTKARATFPPKFVKVHEVLL